MKTHITKQDLEEWRACYTPEQLAALPESATIEEVLHMSNVPIWDRLWAVYHNKVLTDSELEEATLELLCEVFEPGELHCARYSSFDLRSGADIKPSHIRWAQFDFWNAYFWRVNQHATNEDLINRVIEVFEKVLACRA